MFIFDTTKQLAVNSDDILCMIIKEVTDVPGYKYCVIAAVNLAIKPSSVCLYYGKSNQDCINWIVTINNKINSHRVIN